MSRSIGVRDIKVDHPVKIVGPDGRSFEVDLSHDRVDYVTPDGVEVWMQRVGNTCKMRYVNAAGEQVGDVHAHHAAATVYARANGWRDPTAPDWWNDLCIEEARTLIAESEQRRAERKGRSS